MKNTFIFFLFIFLIVLLAGCGVNKHLADDEYYLKNVEIECDDNIVKNKYPLSDYIKQQPNTKWFGFKIPLGLYNLSGPDSKSFLSRFFRKIGEAPVVYDSISANHTITDINRMLSNEGYIYSRIYHVLDFDKSSKKLDLKYVVVPGERYIIRNIVRFSSDKAINDFINSSDSTKSLIKRGAPFNISVLNEERSRITRQLQNKGYYKFNKEYIEYVADTCLSDKYIDITLNVNLHLEDGRSAPVNHKKYTIGKVSFYNDVNKSDKSIDSLLIGNSTIYFKEKMFFRPKLLLSNNKLRSGNVYEDDNLQRTYRNFAKLSAVSYSNVSFIQSDTSNTLDCNIIVNHSRPQSLSFDVEGTNSSGDLGAATAITYQHNNIFKGAETLMFKLRYAYEAITGLEGYDGRNYKELSAEMRLKFPVFLFPFVSRDFGGDHNASSEISLQYNRQDRPEFNRRVLSAAWRYKWGSRNQKISHKFDMLELSYVYMPWMSKRFKELYLDSLGKSNAILKYNYENILITKLGYTYSYNSLGSSTSTYGKNVLSAKANIETSGNLLSAITGITNGRKNSDGQYTFCGIAYAQYVKGDLEITKSIRIDKNNSLALHANFGIAYPYGNSKVLPFEKRYFSGGANSVRGWSIRSLGPGVYNGYDKGINFINQSGDIKLDLNFEWRTDLFWKFSGAFFVDAGNIWTIREYKDQPGGAFKIDEFYKQIAMSYGLGLRINLDFFILRFDAGMKAINPIYNGKYRYPILRPNLDRDFAFHFAVGLPF